MRADGAPVRRREGRRRLRPEAAVRGRARAPHAALHHGDHQRDRAGEGHPGARRRDQRAGDGVDLRHVLDERRPFGARRRHRQAPLDRRLGRTRRGDRAGRPLLHPYRAAEGWQAVPGHPPRGAGLRQRRPQPGAPALGGRGPGRRAVGLDGRGRQPIRHRRRGRQSPTRPSTARSQVSPEPRTRRTTTSSRSSATSSCRPRSSR